MDIKEIREMKHFSQEYVAHNANITLSQYRNIEKHRTNNPGIKTLIDIAKALGVPILMLVKIYLD